MPHLHPDSCGFSDVAVGGFGAGFWTVGRRCGPLGVAAVPRCCFLLGAEEVSGFPGALGGCKSWFNKAFTGMCWIESWLWTCGKIRPKISLGPENQRNFLYLYGTNVVLVVSEKP